MLKRILSPIASLKLTVILLALSMLLIYAGTWAQVDAGSWQVQKEYFHHLWIWIPFQTLIPRKYHVGGGFPMLGGYALGGLLLLNLIAAHTVRFKLTWKRSGVIMIHSAMIALLLGEGISANMAVESRMTIEEGEGAIYSQDVRTSEIAVTDSSPKDHDQVTVIPGDRVAKGGTIHDAKLPFDLRIDSFMPNSTLLGPAQLAEEKAPAVTAGIAQKWGAKSVARVNGLGGAVDLPSAYVTPIVAGKPAGTYLLTLRPLPDKFKQIDGPQEIKVGDKTYLLHLRFKRIYRPYTVYLDKFSFDRYSGTDVARNFSSDVRVVDASHHTDRTVRIWMNHPLRYGGETYYQADWNKNTGRGTVLQVVSNPGWLLPYLACGVGALGLLVHFGMRLITFIRKESKLSGGSGGIPVATLAGVRGNSRKAPSRRERDAEATGPWITRPAVFVPALMVGVALIYVIAKAVPHRDEGAYNVRDFASLPVSFEGRVQPFDSLARNSLRVLSGRETLAVAGVSKRMSATEWLLEVLTHPDKAEGYEIFRIDHPDLISLLELDPKKKLFSFEDLIRTHGNKLLEQWKLAHEAPADERDLYQRKVIDLSAKIGLYRRIAQLEKVLTFSQYVAAATQLVQEKKEGRTVDEKQMERLRKGIFSLMNELQQSRPEDGKVAEGEDPILAVPPIMGADKWHPLDEAVLDRQTERGFEPAAIPLLSVLEEYRGSNADGFNAQVASYEAVVGRLPDSDIIAFEVFFNRFDPFTISMVLYVGAFVLVCVSWLVAAGKQAGEGAVISGGVLTATGSPPLYRSAVGLILVSLVVHTFGLIARIFISGHPPVTNLTSSAIFIAWGVVLLSLGLEWFYRNSIGLLTATTVGFLSLLISHKLSLDGDTMKPLQAVLDTNFWLATHVVCVTLGYSATFLAGALGVVYVIMGVFTPALTKPISKTIAKMIYAIVCFAILFSFVGTILGGIWADQSWGRFWGWDPKENGAVLIVLCNAILLHARWGGMAKERGVALLAIFGNIVTSWSWFGTNMLGVGLHSYGFMDRALMWLLIYVASQVVLIIIGSIPTAYWVSELNESTSRAGVGGSPSPAAAQRKVVST